MTDRHDRRTLLRRAGVALTAIVVVLAVLIPLGMAADAADRGVPAGVPAGAERAVVKGYRAPHELLLAEPRTFRVSRGHTAWAYGVSGPDWRSNARMRAECFGEETLAAFQTWLPVGATVYVAPVEGREGLLFVWARDAPGAWFLVNERLVREGYAFSTVDVGDGRGPDDDRAPPHLPIVRDGDASGREISVLASCAAFASAGRQF